MVLMAHVFPHSPHIVSNSCSGLIAYLDEKSFVLTKQKTDKGGKTGYCYDVGFRLIYSNKFV